MGVHGLWKLIEPSGQMVPLESLAGKTLAVDVSIWLHQAIKGMHDTSGAPVAVAHILILFHRLCKLLFYKIKPVFVFDGGVPALKRQTIAARKQQTNFAKTEAVKVREKLIKNLLKHEAVRQVLSNETASAALGLNSFSLPGPSVEEDLYKLPPVATDFVDSESSEDLTSGDEESEKHIEDIHSIDVTSKEFLSLPAEVRHDILTELIDTRKQSSWKNLDTMPKQSDSFSDFQMNRLLKRRAVQTSLEAAGKEMGGRALSLKELESLLGEQGVIDSKVDLPSKRIAQDSVTRYMLIRTTSNEDVNEEKEGESKSEKFDIMNHLEEVDWSSESDTDVILKKSSKEVTTKLVKVESQEERSETTKPDATSIVKTPTVHITEEVADILSVLEDDEVPSKVKEKVKDLQNRINSKDLDKNEFDSVQPKNQTTSESENFSSNAASTELVREMKVESSISSTETDTQKQSFEVEKESKPVPELNILTETFQPPSDQSNQLNDANSVKISQETVPEELKTEVLKDSSELKPTEISIEPDKEDKLLTENKVVSDDAENVKNETDSSDSENDFVVVSEKKSLLNENETAQQNTNLVRNDQSENSLTVILKPAKVNEKDDIFADLFQSNSDKPSIYETQEVEENEKNLTEKISSKKDSSSANEYKEEFERHLLSGDVDNLKKTLEDQQQSLLMEHGKQERHALNPTDQMYLDAQELLRLFGVPFVVAPMEAEAQCALLNVLGLTEGTITDDSDIWLFGGRVVYKNFFNQNKHVLEYRSEDIQKYFKLSREDMIKMALLVGSDYTVGLNGIGPVTALEILAAFRSASDNVLDTLQKFRDWFMGRCKEGPPRLSLKKKIRNTIISPGFPNKSVVEAYLNPQVDDSKEPFSWAKPNVDLIQKYVKEKMGWSTEKCNELLRPVMKKMEENKSQFTMEKYFKIMQKTQMTEGMLSKRVESAIKRLGSESDEKQEEDLKPKRKKQKKAQKVPLKNDEQTEDVPSVSEKQTKKPKKPTTINVLNSVSPEKSKTRLINEKLHQDVKVPQKEMSQKLLNERKQQAIEIFRTFKKGGKKKTKVFAKKEVKLSESSSDED